jgi:DNA-binding ferritin-like protein
MSTEYRDLPNLLRKLVDDYSKCRHLLKLTSKLLNKLDDENTYRIFETSPQTAEEIENLIDMIGDV